MHDCDEVKMASFIKVVGECSLLRLVMVEVSIVENGDVMDLRARIWSGFMYKPRTEV